MEIVGRLKLEEMALVHPDVRSAVDAWIAEVLEARWGSPVDVKTRYPSASILERNTVIFNLRGNNYRVHATIAYKTGIVVVNRAGTHAEYSNWKF